MDALDRLSPDDLMSLVGAGRSDNQVGAVLLFGGPRGLDPTAVRDAIERRLPAVPRLRRRLTPVPLDCGRPVWVDDPDFDLTHHLGVRDTTVSLSQQQLLDLAAELVAEPLDRDRPLWRATVVPEVEEEQTALIVVFHHVLADGVAGLQLLSELFTPGAAPADLDFPRRRLRRRDLVVDAFKERVRSIGRIPSTMRRLVAAARELGPTLTTRAESCSLNQPTGGSRVLRTVEESHPNLTEVAHRVGVTVNDLVLTVVTGALAELLAGRGEWVHSLVVSVPFAARPQVGRTNLGNHSGVVR